MFKILKFEDWENKQDLQFSCIHLFYTAEWFQTLKDTYDFNIQVVLNNDKFQLAFSQIEDVKGKRLVNLPFSDYTPSCGLDPESYNQILAFLHDEYPDHSITLKTDLHYESPIKADLSKKAVTYIIPLDDQDSLQRLEAYLKNSEKAQNDNINIRLNKDRRALRDFYRLYHLLRFEKYNRIPQPFRFFEAIHSNFIQKGKGAIIEVLDNSKVIASSIILQHHDTLYYKYGYYTDNENKPSDLLFREMISYAKSKKFKKVDLGVSDLSSDFEGQIRWKEDMGGKPHPISYWEYRSIKSDQEREEKVMRNLLKLTNAMIKSNLNPKQTSAFSEKIYSLFA